jgi:hypothetical protein
LAGVLPLPVSSPPLLPPFYVQRMRGFLGSFFVPTRARAAPGAGRPAFLGLQRKWRVRVLLDETFEFRGIRQILDPCSI